MFNWGGGDYDVTFMVMTQKGIYFYTVNNYVQTY